MKYNLILSISLTIILSTTFIKCDCILEIEKIQNVDKFVGTHYHFIRTRFAHLIKCVDVSLDGQIPLKSLLKNTDSTKTNDIRAIDIQNSPMPSVERTIFVSYPSVEKLILESDDIKDIEPNAFADMVNLTDITISDNYLKTIKDGAFNGVPKLVNLNLHNNEITRLENINQISSLEMLNISENKIRNISADDFQKLQSLKLLDLSGNFISDIDSKMFLHLESLTDLYLKNNYLKSFTIKPFVKPINKLDISSNFLETIEIDANKTFILYNLDMSDNFISALKKGQFKNLEKLSTLNLSMNGIKEIDVDAFENLHNLTMLHLDENLISSFYIGTFRDLTALVVLNVSLNEVERFEMGVFTGLDVLRVLDASNNRLQLIDLRVFRPIKNVAELYLHGNLLHNQELYPFSNRFSNLKYLSLNFKQIGCTSLAYSLRHFGSYVEVKQGSHVKTHNVHGIACDPDLKEIERVDYEKEILSFVEDFPVMKILFIIVLLISILMFIMKMMSTYNINYDYCRSMFRRRNEAKLIENGND